jgi:hypothetical protein
MRQFALARLGSAVLIASIVIAPTLPLTGCGSDGGLGWGRQPDAASTDRPSSGQVVDGFHAEATSRREGCIQNQKQTGAERSVRARFSGVAALDPPSSARRARGSAGSFDCSLRPSTV